MSSGGNSRSVNVGGRGTFPTRGSNGGINSQKTQPVERSSRSRGATRTVDRAGQGGKGDVSPMTGPKTNKDVSN